MVSRACDDDDPKTRCWATTLCWVQKEGELGDKPRSRDILLLVSLHLTSLRFIQFPYPSSFLHFDLHTARLACTTTTGLRYQPTSSQLYPFSFDSHHGLFFTTQHLLIRFIRQRQQPLRICRSIQKSYYRLTWKVSCSARPHSQIRRVPTNFKITTLTARTCILTQPFYSGVPTDQKHSLVDDQHIAPLLYSIE